MGALGDWDQGMVDMGDGLKAVEKNIGKSS